MNLDDTATSPRTGFDYLSVLNAFFGAIQPLNPEMISRLQKHTYPLAVKSGKFLISPLLTDDTLYFIVKGIIRGFRKDGNREITTWINAENELVGSIRNFGLNGITEEYLQALEDTTLIALPRKFLEEMYRDFPETNTTARIILEKNYRDAEERAYICRIPSAIRRYQYFINAQPQLAQRIPQKYIASYLGIRLETLSRIRKQA